MARATLTSSSIIAMVVAISAATETRMVMFPRQLAHQVPGAAQAQGAVPGPEGVSGQEVARVQGGARP